MRWLLLIDTLTIGGSQVQLSHLANGLADRSNQVFVCAYHPNRTRGAGVVLDDAVVYEELGLLRRRRRLPETAALEDFIVAHDIEVACAFLQGPALRLSLAARRLRERNDASPVVIVSERAMNRTGVRGFATDLVQLQFHRGADVVVCNSEGRARRVRKMLARSPTRVTHIPNGVPPRPEVGSGASRPCDSVPLRILALATVLATKGPVDLAQALALAALGVLPAPRVSWAGKYSPDDRDSRRGKRRTDEVLETHSLQSQWRWMGHVDDVTTLFADHDVLVHPSWSEGMPNAVCEAMAHGVPVVTTDVGDAGRLVRQSRCGIVVPPHDPASLMSAITSLAETDPTARAEMGRRGRQFVEEHLSVKQMVDRFASLAAPSAETEG